ncbi:MAG: oligosaccharide flippase family protein [Bacteroidia bacterium]|jgi:O-antigen/teichoic acid export membrane protein|nr:oligosaccharide flippase family protein [Bacteroidia bacterium]MBP7244225.1 oligosaccharide flippase family protein [Bacteroidia bacterium]
MSFQISLGLPKQLIKSETAVIYADQALVSGLNFLSSVVLARYLGLEGFGIYSIAWLGVMIASSINQPFIIAPMQTLSGKKVSTAQSDYLQALVFKQLIFAALMGLLSFLVVIVMSYVLDQWKVQSIILAFPLAVFAFLLQDFFRRYFFVIGKPYKALLIDAIAYGGVLLASFTIHYVRSMDAQFILLLTAVFFLYASLVGLWSLDQLRFKPKVIKATILEHWDFSKWLTVTALLQWFSGNLFIIAAGAILGPVAVGVTRMAQNIVGITHVLFLAMENIIPVRASQHQRNGGNEEMFRYLWKFALQMGAVTLTLLTTLAIFSKQIILFFYGTEFVAYQHLLIGFCALYVIIFIGYPMRYAIRTLENTRLIFISFIATSIFSILTAYPIIRTFGLNGVLIGLVITQLITLVLYYYSLRKEVVKLSFE